MSVSDVAGAQIEATAASVAEVATREPPDLARLLANEAPYLDVPARAGAAFSPAAQRWLLVRAAFERLLTSWLALFASGSDEPLDDELGRSNVLDRQADGLEGGDRFGVAARGPAGVHRADLHQVGLRK